MSITKPRAPSRMASRQNSGLSDNERENNSLRSKQSSDSGFFARGAVPPSPAMSTHSFFESGSMTPSTLLNRLENLLEAKSNEIQLAGRLGEQLLSQQAELERRIGELEEDANVNDHRGLNNGRVSYESDDERTNEGKQYIGDEVKRKLELLEEDLQRWDVENEGFYQNIGNKTAKPAQVVQTFDAQGDNTEESTPLKSVQANRRARNIDLTTRAKDVEFATDISQGLLVECRRLQVLLTERDDLIAGLTRDKDSLSLLLDEKDVATRTLEETVDRYKEENWNLEVTLQEIKTNHTELTTQHARLDNEHKRTVKALATIQTETEAQKSEIDVLQKSIDEAAAKRELDLAEMRKNVAGLTRERSDLQGALEATQGELARSVARRSVSGQIARSKSGFESNASPRSDIPEEEEILEDEDEDVFGAKPRRKTGDGLLGLLTPGRPTFEDVERESDFSFDSEGQSMASDQSPALHRGSQPSEVANLKASLAHSHKTITTLRAALAREKSKRLGNGNDADFEDIPSDNLQLSNRGQARRGRGRRGAARNVVPSHLSHEWEDDNSIVEHDDNEVEELGAEIAEEAGREQTRYTPSLASLEGFDPAFITEFDQANSGLNLGNRSRPTSYIKAQSIRPSSGMFGSIPELARLDVETIDASVGTHEFEAPPRIVEVIKEVPVEVIRNVEIIKEVPIEVIKNVEIVKEVEKIVNVPHYIEKVVEKRIEVPVEKIVEKRVEIPVEKIVERLVEMRVEVPVDRIVETRVEIPIERIVEKIIEVPVDRIVEKTVLVDKIVERVVEKIIEVPVDRIVEKRVEVPVERITENRVEVPIEKIVEKLVYVDKIVEVPTYVEKIVQVEVPKHIEVERLVEVPKFIEKIVEKTVEKIVEVAIQRAPAQDNNAQTEPMAEIEPRVVYLPAPIVSRRMPTSASAESVMTATNYRAVHDYSDGESDMGHTTEAETEFEDARETIGAPTPSSMHMTPSKSQSDFYSARDETESLASHSVFAGNGRRSSAAYFAANSTFNQSYVQPAGVDVGVQTESSLPEPVSLPIAALYTANAAPTYLQTITSVTPFTPQRRETIADDVTPTQATVERAQPVIAMPAPPAMPPPPHISPRKSANVRPPRPSSPPPPELLQRAQTPVSDLMSRVNSTRQNHDGNAYASPRLAASASSLRQSAGSRQSVNELGRTMHNRGMQASTMSSVKHSRASSVASSATSDGGFRSDGLPAARLDEAGLDSGSTDPAVIHAITQTMIGEFLYKYTRKVMGGQSEKRHKRFFWVHPYTRTLYWSNNDPASAAVNQSSAKSIYIENVRQVVDPNPFPPGLNQQSIIIQTPNREIKITAPTRERHKLWFDAINYLLARPTAEESNDRNSPRSMSLHEGLSGTVKGKRKYSTPTAGRASTLSGVYRNPASASESNLLSTSKRAKSRASTASLMHMKRPETPAAQYIAHHADFGSPRSVRSYDTSDAEFESVNDHSLQVIDPNEIIEDGDDDGFEGFENVRVCCGAHDVGQLSHRKKHSHVHTHSHSNFQPDENAPPLPTSPSLRVTRASADQRVGGNRPRRSLGNLFAAPPPSPTKGGK